MGAAVEDAPIVKLVNMLINQAVTDRASDIHIEPAERDVRIRYRIDGVLHEVMRSPKNIQNGLISRLKIMADINIAERRVPQDGRVSLDGRRQGHRPPCGHPSDRLRREDRASGSWTRRRVLLKLEDLGFAESTVRDRTSRPSASRTGRSW